MAVSPAQRAEVADQMNVMIEAAKIATAGQSDAVVAAAVHGAASTVAGNSALLGASQSTSDWVYKVVIGILGAIAVVGAVAFFFAVLDDDTKSTGTDVLTLVLPIITGLLALFATPPQDKK